MCPLRSEGKGRRRDPAAKGVQRLFFALWPDTGQRQQLLAQCERFIYSAVPALHGHPVPADNLHLTLAFLGDVTARQRACVERMATSVCDDNACSPFELVLDRSGYWSRSRVLWLGLSEPPESLLALAARLQAGASGCGLSLDVRPYQPHLTLMRKVFPRRGFSESENLSVEPLCWPVSGFALMRSVAEVKGVRYEVLQEWRF